MHFLVLSIPLIQPLHAKQIEQSLQEEIVRQLGDHQLLRWAITAVDPPQGRATVEAVVTTM